MATNGKVLSINVGRPREFVYNGRPAKSAVWKVPVVGRVAARGANLEGDDQADRKVHGGPDKAVYAYAVEDLRWWEEKLGRSLPYGQFGENLTTEGIEVNDALVGERWEIGSTVLEVSEPRVPLLAAWSSDGRSDVSASLYRRNTTRGISTNHC
jgi:MOSC domain-containing protein YiiM